MTGKVTQVFSFVTIFFVILLVQCTPVNDPDEQNGNNVPQVREAFPNLEFVRPLDIGMPDDESNRFFVLEQSGKIWVFPNDSGVTSDQTTLFLDITGKVNSGGNEQGLLGLAFHPDFRNNGYFYVDYTAGSGSGYSVVSRFQVQSGNANEANPASEMILLQVQQPYGNHNGGHIAFSEFDEGNYLYIALGDGGSGGDPQGNGQDRSTLLGSILRIDVDFSTAQQNYGIPATNPYAGNTQGYREEVFAYGLRNPWRFSFDAETGELWAGDVGQNAYEEVDIIRSGKNYGWNIMEGFHCYEASDCDTTGLTLPVWEYDHSAGQSVTGGYVYRGSLYPEMVGKYIYADYLSGTIWTLEQRENGDPMNSVFAETELLISSFGIDNNNEIYFCDFANGKIYRL